MEDVRKSYMSLRLHLGAEISGLANAQAGIVSPAYHSDRDGMAFANSDCRTLIPGPGPFDNGQGAENCSVPDHATRNIFRKRGIVEETRSYINPIYPRSCADPFVLKFLNEYWLYCTGIWSDGRCFGVLHSRDLVEWREIGGALERFDEQAPCWWAPEVRQENGLFLMYYSVGNEEYMQLRVARADRPGGPFVDCGVRLTTEDFAIDAHVFVDEDGTRWMFYATDFLTHTRIGTGTVCDRMLDAFTLAGQPQPVTRAGYDWQIYDPCRIEKGGVRWHTVEGPFVLKHKGLYYQMFSGGNWKNETYGVSYAASDHIRTESEWRQVADGERVRPILCTIPGKVLGPGHNSVAQGPDQQQLFCVYHCWSEQAGERVLAIDRLEFIGERMIILGPSFTEQPAPILPSFADHFDVELSAGLEERWSPSGGKWSVGSGIARQELDDGRAEISCSIEFPYFIAAVSLRMRDRAQKNGGAGMRLIGEGGPLLALLFIPQDGCAVVETRESGRWRRQKIGLPSDFDFTAFHAIRSEVNGLNVTIGIDGQALNWQGALGSRPNGLVLMTQDSAAEFAGFALTEGWEDSFTNDQADPWILNWSASKGRDQWRVSDQQLWYTGMLDERSLLTKGPLPQNYELVINARLVSAEGLSSSYGFLPAANADDDGPLLKIEPHGSAWAVHYELQTEQRVFALPDNFSPAIYQQFRFRKWRDRLIIQHEGNVLGEIEVRGKAEFVGLYCFGAVAFDLVRVTALAE